MQREEWEYAKERAMREDTGQYCLYFTGRQLAELLGILDYCLETQENVDTEARRKVRYFRAIILDTIGK